MQTIDFDTLRSNQKKLFFQHLTDLLEEEEWGEGLIIKTEEKCGFKIGFHHLLFLGGLTEIIDAYMCYLDNLMLLKLKSLPNPISVRDKIALALKIRIKECCPKYIHLKNTALFLLPNNINLGTVCGLKTSDLIWREAGDKSTDFNYHSKRALLLAVYISAILFYMNDNSPNSSDTDEFIAKSLENVIKIGKLKSLIKIENIPFVRLLL